MAKRSKPKAKKGLYANINNRKKKGISRSKKKSTISKKAFAFMKGGFKKKDEMRCALLQELIASQFVVWSN